MTKRAALVILAIAVLLALVVGAALVDRYRSDSNVSADAPSAAKYHCPMHPTVISDRPGSCPICGMDLVPIPESHGAHDADPNRPAGGASDSRRAGTDVSGLARVRINPQKRQLIGVRTVPAARVSFRRPIRAAGRIVADETRLRQVTTKIDGYVERLHANAVGQVVQRGQALLEIYSPELLASQNEHLVALAAGRRTGGSSLPSVAGYGDDLVASSRKRLQLFDVSAEQIDRLERTGVPERVLTIDSPISGVITTRNVVEGQKIMSGMPLLEVVDLSRIWTIASIYEYELPFVRVGQGATVTLSYVPGASFEGSISFIYPTVDPQTRTVPVRIEIPNLGLQLKPEMFVDVVLQADLGERLAVPDSAVLDTGTRSIAFVETEEGVFEPREVKIGLRLEHEYEVVAGISEGERVVVSGNFLIDAESKLKAALAGMSSTPEPKSTPPGHVH